MSAAAVGLGAAPRADDSNPLLKTSSSTNGRFIWFFPGDDGLDSECTGGGGTRVVFYDASRSGSLLSSVDDLLRAPFAGANHLAVPSLLGGDHVERVAAHVFGIELCGDFRFHLFAGLRDERGRHRERGDQ